MFIYFYWAEISVIKDYKMKIWLWKLCLQILSIQDVHVIDFELTWKFAYFKQIAAELKK